MTTCEALVYLCYAIVAGIITAAALAGIMPMGYAMLAGAILAGFLTLEGEV